jgi:hypothetical protein
MNFCEVLRRDPFVVETLGAQVHPVLDKKVLCCPRCNTCSTEKTTSLYPKKGSGLFLNGFEKLFFQLFLRPCLYFF